MKRGILISFFAFILLMSCKKDSDSRIVFDGITLTDTQGSYMGYKDTTDWRLDDKFTVQEMQLFDSVDFRIINQKLLSNLNGTTGKVIFYPNPITSFGTFHINLENFILNFVLVNNEFNTLASYRGVDRTSLSITFHSFENDIYRIYYVIQNLQFNIIGMGHGDVKKE